MNDFSPSDLKLVNGGRVEYVIDEGKRSLYWNIPIANTTTVLLGSSEINGLSAFCVKTVHCRIGSSQKVS